jgi:pimeloyl-ACP methyl ester carboxylesterase
MDRKVFLTLVAALSVLPIPALLPEEASKVPESEINAALASPDSFLRHNTWKKLNPEDDGNYRTLVKVLKSLPWFDRDGAVIALAKAATESTLQKMVKALKDDKDPMVRQGMAMALAKMNDEKFYPHLYEALNDKSPVVRRIVVNALRVHKKKEAVSALVDAFQKEEDPVVRSFMVESLNQLTQAYQGPDPRAWFVWWEAAKADPEYELGKNDEIAQRKAEELGNKLKKRTTVSVSGEMTLETEERGRQTSKGMPIIVLPPYGFSKDIMTPFLSELEKTNKLFYVELPGREAFKNLPNVGNTNLPFFPLDQMVKAFEDLRKETKQERFALMACGLSCWIAMRYASLYPQSVSHLVFIAPFSSNKAVGDGYDRCSRQGQAKKDVELHHAAMSHSINTQTGQTEHDRYHEEKKIPKPEGEDGSLDRREWSLFFKDERDSLATILYPIKDSKKRMGFLYPDFKCFSEPRRNIPTIVIAGAASILTSQQDCDAIAKHYGGRLYMYPNSSCMPFAEESATFNKHMAALLRENQKSKKDSKDKAKKPKDGEEESVPGSTGEPDTAAGAKPEKGRK